MDAAAEMKKRYRNMEREEYFGYRDSHEIPNLILNTTKTNFYDFTVDDFELINYDPIKPQLKLELGI